jgi:hypothetical protein
MKFECGDLDRAFAVPELMAEAREHMRSCAVCRREYRLWNEISEAARELHQEWESPDLWARIRSDLAAERKPRAPWWQDWRTWALAASVFVGAVLLVWLNVVRSTAPNTASRNRDFLTEQALSDVQRAEEAYTASIDRLSQLAAPKLQQKGSAVAANYREKLTGLDSAIAEVRANLARNQFNASLQTELAALYREKQRTLQDLLTHDQKN